MNKYVFTFSVKTSFPFSTVQETFDWVKKGLYEEENIDFIWCQIDDFKYRVVMIGATRKRALTLCHVCGGVHLRELDPFSVKCMLEILVSKII